ncbi:MAG TPA: response regulator [Gemmatimonadaceae bacterium]|nr:response regulator [Gemmatimonadaceae bacterium]
MDNYGRILIADDDQTFLNATADLLRREHYECVTVGEATSAKAALNTEAFDLLITDLEMPGNADLQLVKDLASENGGLPVIILTGYPSVRSAVACIELPVAAYLTKPVSFDILGEKVGSAVKRYRTYRMMQSTESRLQAVRAEVAQMKDMVPNGAGSSIDVFLALTLRNVMGSLTDLEQLGRALSHQPVQSHPCQLFNCPRGAQMRNAIMETIKVLESTKGTFKSKTLGDLRRQLELLLQVN